MQTEPSQDQQWSNSQRQAPAQRRKASAMPLEDNRSKEPPIQRRPNNTGLPDNLKTGMENLSGMSLDHVRVHYNSSQPAAVQAHAYAQGSNIYLGSGQERHLPHELGHVVQQMQGQVQPTTSVAGMPVNNDPSLEKKADKLGEAATRLGQEAT